MKWYEDENEVENWNMGRAVSSSRETSDIANSAVIDVNANKWVQIIFPEVLEKELLEVIKILGIESYTLFDAKTNTNNASLSENSQTMLMAEVENETLSLLLDEMNLYIEKGHPLTVLTSDVEVMTQSN
ncbi:hypothetical protein GHNINEIG_00910 [Hydrogenovibrio crunogenus]|uniref:Uncharacterized protein n=1 Tax=Hydrogenovibrio crunogenus TaxID=39765 RepID=A0A4P7NYJ9_9GAMM|nr:hypothetical protein [Hydrogenovibrio crunogenus]QBZ82871.1 hypothetical protein GHNINEIG_00910 [Hydrogenovibrio crunogenus]